MDRIYRDWTSDAPELWIPEVQDGPMNMACAQCEQLERRLLQANIDYVNANSELLDIARRPYDAATDEQRYVEVTSKLAAARKSVETVQHEFVEHKTRDHREPTRRVAGKAS